MHGGLIVILGRKKTRKVTKSIYNFTELLLLLKEGQQVGLETGSLLKFLGFTSVMATCSGNVFLTYFDSTLYSSDVNLFDDGNWLNDHAILFAYEHFQHVQFENSGTDLLFVHPANTMLLQYGDNEDLNDLSSSLKLRNRKLVFIPVNNNSNGLVTNGSHWSLIAYQSSTNTFVHFDSMGASSMNHKAAKDIVKNLTSSVFHGANYANGNTPPQKNGFDCGMYVLCISEILAKSFVEGKDPLRESIELLKVCTPNYVKERRKSWPILIQKIRDKVNQSLR